MPRKYGNAPQLIGQSIYFHSVLVDTGAFVALQNSSDNNHDAATACLDDLVMHRLPLVVSLPTIYESHRRILYDLNEQKAMIFLENIFDGSLNIERMISEDEQAAIQIMHRFAGQRITFTDASNIALMNRLGIRLCFCFDHHFTQAGITVIPPLHDDISGSV